MFSNCKYLILMALLLVSCSSTYRMDGIRRGMVTMGLSVPQDMQPERDTVESIKVDSIKGTMSDGPMQYAILTLEKWWLPMS